MRNEKLRYRFAMIHNEGSALKLLPGILSPDPMFMCGQNDTAPISAN